MAYLRTAALATAALGFAAGLGSPVTRAHAAVVCAATGTRTQTLRVSPEQMATNLSFSKSGLTDHDFFQLHRQQHQRQGRQDRSQTFLWTPATASGKSNHPRRSGPWTTTIFSPTSTSLSLGTGCSCAGK